MSGAEPNYELVRLRLKKARQLRRMSLRRAADDIGTSAATLSRIERGAGTPDMPTLGKLIAWLDIDRNAVFNAREPNPRSMPKQVEVLLRADKNLDARTAKTLAKIFDTAYREMTET